jgi:hypothetical protein
MNALSRFCRELDTLLSDIIFSGLKNVHPEVLEKLTLLEGTAKELGMDRGAELITQFAASLRNHRLAAPGTPGIPGGKNRETVKLLCALDFYNRNVMGNML